MNARRIPFQFSTTDPLARQRELERRFGLQPTCPEMYVDVNNPLSMGTTHKEISSPRLQHRVPIFAEGYDQPIHSSSVDCMASVPEKKPNVRVIPIEVEGAERSPRHRTYSGPADTLKDRCGSLASERNGVPPFKRYNFEDFSSKPSTPRLNAEPKVFNIPIQVEGANVSRSPKSTVNKVEATRKTKSTIPTSNGCSQSKMANKVESPNKSEVPSESNENQADQSKNTVEILLKKIEDVLNEFKTFETGVVEFTGTSKDKQYRYLDEMLTRCMLRLDDIDTMGNEEIRLARKSAVKKIQASIDLLESRANVKPVTSTESSEMQLVHDEKNVDNEVNMENKSDDNVVSTESTVSSEMNQIDSDNKDQSKISDSNMNDDKSKIKSMKTEEKLNDITDVEMCEMPQTSAVNTSSCETTNTDSNSENKPLNLSEVSSKADNIMEVQENSAPSLQQQNNVPEIEMSEEISLDKMSSNDAQSSVHKCVEQNSISNDTVTNDVEMLDEKDPTLNLDKAKESLDEFAKSESNLPKSSEISEIEMVEVGDISSTESGEKKESDSKTIDHTSDCFKEKTGDVNTNVQITSTVSSEDAEVNSGVSTDLLGPDSTSETSQSDKDKTLK